MVLLNITFTEIFKIWFAWNIIPYVIVAAVIFGIMGIWALILKLKGYNLNDYYIGCPDWNKKSWKVKMDKGVQMKEPTDEYKK